MRLPTERSTIKRDPRDLVILIYGQPKIGKSTFCSHADGALFLATEPGLNNLEVFQVPITTWSEFLETCFAIAEGNHEFRTVVIDTIDNLFKLCRESVLKKHGLVHEQDASYGKGYDLVKFEFQRRLTALSLLPLGLMMVSHSEEKEVKTRTGSAYKVAPTLPNQARKIVLGMADLVLYAETEEITDDRGKPQGFERVLRTKPTTVYEAGDRTGLLPDTLPLDYHAFAAALAAPTDAAAPETGDANDDLTEITDPFNWN